MQLSPHHEPTGLHVRRPHREVSSGDQASDESFRTAFSSESVAARVFLSPTVSAAAAISEELLEIEETQEQSGPRGVDSTFHLTTETLTGCQAQDQASPDAPPGGHVASTPEKSETAASTGDRGGGGAAGDGPEQAWAFQSGFTPIEHHLHRSPSAAADDVVAKFGMFSPGAKTPPGAAPVPYEAFFDLALPRAASLFVGQKTAAAVHKAALERLLQREEGLEDGEEEGVAAASPLEVLDRLVQQGSDTHDKVLKR